MWLPPPPRAIFLGAPGVSLVEHAPPADLAPWVAAVWRMHATGAAPLRILPDGCLDLVGDRVVGPMRAGVVVPVPAGAEGWGVRLRPGAFTALFGVPARELLDLELPVSDVLGARWAGSLLDAPPAGGAPPRARRAPRPASVAAGPWPTSAAAGPWPAEAGGALAALRVAARTAPVPDPLAALALEAPDAASLAREAGFSPRQVRRRLVLATGHGPKRLGRIGRMQRVLAAGRGESWARTAAEHGFADEAHLANDVRALAGATPHAMAVLSKTARAQAA